MRERASGHGEKTRERESERDIESWGEMVEGIKRDKYDEKYSFEYKFDDVRWAELY